MTLDEAIEHCKKVAKEQEKCNVGCSLEHRQLAIWLSALKAITGNSYSAKSNMIKKYKKKPVIIEAIQWNGENLSEIGEFTEGKVKVKNHESVLIISTLEGNMYVSLNDYIIKGVNGDFYPCKPYIFAKTYEEVMV